jgi:hypothetical protein
LLRAFLALFCLAACEHIFCLRAQEALMIGASASPSLAAASPREFTRLVDNLWVRSPLARPSATSGVDQRTAWPGASETMSVLSDRNAKQDLIPINSLQVLERVSRLPIQSWAYTNSASVRHLGPMAQDFHAAFGLGEDRQIAAVDADGVALAAIQGLNIRLEEREREIEQLKARVQRLEKLIEALAPARKDK